MNFIDRNNKERLKFIDFWANYVKTHPDKVWSKQQNVIINSCLRSTKMTKEQFLHMKGEK